MSQATLVLKRVSMPLTVGVNPLGNPVASVLAGQQEPKYRPNVVDMAA